MSGRVDLLDATELFSFTFGFARARIAVSRGLLESVSVTRSTRCWSTSGTTYRFTHCFIDQAIAPDVIGTARRPT